MILPNSDETLTFRANGDLSNFTGVKVDGTPIDGTNYTAFSGSTVITLKNDYLKTLSVGAHKLIVVYNDGECSTDFEVKASSEQTDPTDSPKQDDPQQPTDPAELRRPPIPNHHRPTITASSRFGLRCCAFPLQERWKQRSATEGKSIPKNKRF